MRASIRHVGYTLHAHIYYFECMNFACKHVVFGGLILGMCMCLICGYLFDMCTSVRSHVLKLYSCIWPVFAFC